MGSCWPIRSDTQDLCRRGLPQCILLAFGPGGILFLCCFCSFGSWVGIYKVSNYLANCNLFVQHTRSIEQLEIICMGWLDQTWGPFAHKSMLRNLCIKVTCKIKQICVAAFAWFRLAFFSPSTLYFFEHYPAKKQLLAKQREQAFEQSLLLTSRVTKFVKHHPTKQKTTIRQRKSQQKSGRKYKKGRSIPCVVHFSSACR